MKQPHHKFLLYLVATKHTDQEIRDLCSQIELEDVSTIYLNKLRSDLMAMGIDDLSDYLKLQDKSIAKLHRQDFLWAEELGLLDFHELTPDFDAAHGVFRDSRKRKYINLYSLCIDIKSERIVDMFDRRFSLELSNDQLFMYLDYFFDTDGMTSRDWNAYLSPMSPHDRKLFRAAPNRRTRYIQWRLGDSVDINPDDVAEELMSDFFFLHRDAMDAQRDGWEEVCVKFAGVSLNASDRVSRNKSNGMSAGKQLLMLFTEKEEAIASFDELDQGDEGPPGESSSGGEDSP
jgi:hypothetical protein